MGRLRLCFVWFFLLALTGGLAPLTADEWRSPSPMDLRSPNGVFAVHIAVGESVGDLIGFKGAKKGKYAQANLTGLDGERHVFTLLNPVAPVDAVLFDDGTLLAFDNWHNIGYGAVLAAYSKSGAVLWSAELEKLFSAEAIERIPISISSRWWRRQPFEWTSEEDEAGDRWVLITLWNEDRLRVRLKDGAVRYVQVRDLGEDPARLLQRAKDLAQRDDLKGATKALRQMIARDPALIDAYRELASVYQRQDDQRAAIDILLQGVRANPAQEVKRSAGGYQDDARLWLVLYLARAYAEAGQLREAEQTLQECLRLDPGFWVAGQELAGIWLDKGREAEADRLLADFFEVLRGDPEHWMAATNLTRAASEIGRIYTNHRRDAKALSYYEQAYRREGDPDLHLALSMAEVLERLGRDAEALSVLRRLQGWLSGKTEGYEFYVKKVDEDIRRLTAKQFQENTPAPPKERGPTPP